MIFFVKYFWKLVCLQFSVINTVLSHHIEYSIGFLFRTDTEKSVLLLEIKFSVSSAIRMFSKLDFRLLYWLLLLLFASPDFQSQPHHLQGVQVSVTEPSLMKISFKPTRLTSTFRRIKCKYRFFMRVSLDSVWHFDTSNIFSSKS